MNQTSRILCFILFICESISGQFVRPVKSELKNDPSGTMSLTDSISLFEMIESRRIIKIDLNRPSRQQAIVIRNSKTVKLNLYCSINIPPSLKTTDVVTQFCYQASLSKDAICSDLRTMKSETKLFNFKISVSSILNETGYDIILNSAMSGDIDLSGYYYCKTSTSSSGVVLSNVMEIRDVIYWRKNLITNPPEPVLQSYKLNLEASQMPKSFACLDQIKPYLVKDAPHWIELEFKSIVNWAWCPVSKQKSNLMELEKTYIGECLSQTISRCDKPEYLCPYQSDKLLGWKEFISFDGTMTLISGQRFHDYGNKLDGYALMCYYKTKDNYKALRYIANDFVSTQFLKGLQWTDVMNERINIEVISPQKQTIKVGILKKGFTLTAFYYCPAQYTYDWSRNGNKMYNSSSWIISPYSAQYIQKVTIQSEGEYYLRVKSGEQEVEFIFNLIVASPPILMSTSIGAISSSIYSMVGSNVSIVYRYKARLTNVFVYINGLVYIPGQSGHDVFRNDLTKISFYLKDLQFSVTRENLPDNIIDLTYTASNVSFSSMVMLSQDHSLIFEARNIYGISRSHLNIYVIKYPTYKNLPISDNCTVQCSSQLPHLFRCEIDSKYYTDREVVVEKFWMINGMRLDSLPFYTTFFKEDLKGLHMRPIISNNSEYDLTLKLLFKNANLVCRVRLLYPDSLGLSDKDLILEKRIIFDTNNDPNFVSHSTAIVSLDWEPTIASASYTWVVFFLIAIVLIAMFVFLLVRLSLQDNGKSYQIEKLELAKGINRDEEIENESIRPYVRSNNKNKDTKITSSSANGSKSMANKSFLPGYKPPKALGVIDDEDELEDASKFNEEGSFIGVYASKDKLSNLPTEVKSTDVN